MNVITKPQVIEERLPASERVDYPRDARMALIEVESISDGVLFGNNGVLFKHGWNRARILESDLAIAQTLVQSEEDMRNWELAQAQFERDRKAHVEAEMARFREGGGGQPGETEYRLHQEAAEKLYANSEAATHRRLFHCDVKPLRHLTVLERGIVNITDVARVENEKSAAVPVATAITTAVKEVLGAAHQADANVMAAAIAQAFKEALATHGKK